MSSGPKISHDVLQTVCKKRKEKQSRSLIDSTLGKNYVCKMYYSCTQSCIFEVDLCRVSRSSQFSLGEVIVWLRRLT